MFINEHFKMNKLSESTCLEETDPPPPLSSHRGSTVLYLGMEPCEISPIYVDKSSGAVILGDHIIFFIFFYYLPLDTFFFCTILIEKFIHVHRGF